MIEYNRQAMTRDRSLDVAKGILISLLVAMHFAGFAVNDFHVTNPVTRVISQYEAPLIACYFMQTFFIITGMCSNFDAPIKSFVVKQIRTLLVPAFVFGCVHAVFGSLRALSVRPFLGYCHLLLSHGYSLYWFCVALFLAKIIYRFLHHIVKNDCLELIALLGLSFIGAALFQLGYDFDFAVHRQIFALTVFLAIGRVFKRCICEWKVGVVCMGLYGFVVVSGYCAGGGSLM